VADGQYNGEGGGRGGWSVGITEELDTKAPEDPSLWIYLAVAVLLVLLGGAFAGLTIALMGQVR
jgi:hypothetical protein